MRFSVRLIIIVMLLAIGLVIYSRRSHSTPPSHTSGNIAENVIPSGPVPASSSRNKSVSPARLPAQLETISPLDEWSRQMIEDIRLALKSTNDSERSGVVDYLFPQLIVHDLPSAARLAQSMEPGGLRETMLRLVAQAWVQKDSEGALGWASGLSDSSERENALGIVCLAIAQTDPQSAASLADRFNLGEKSGVLESLVQTWAAHDLSSALDWTMQRAEGEQRNEMISQLAFVQAQTDPARAAALVAEKMPPGPDQDEAAISILHQWALKDPAAAEAWLKLFPAGSLQDRGAKDLAGLGSQ
jgi:hypothetical protein